MSEEPTAEPTELAAEVRGTLSAELAGLCTEHGIDPAPALEWTWRMRRVLGRAYVGEHMIRLSVWLDEDQASDTLRHELAHIAAGVGRQAPHGERWQAWARRLGVEPRATARAAPAHAPAGSSKRRYWGLECAGCGLRLARVRVLPGLYHRTCGPKKGRLARVLQGERDEVFTWIAQGHLAE